MDTIRDQLGYEVSLSSSPTRIISLVPSITEYLYDLALEEETVGITKFCVHPEKWRKTKSIIGGTKQQHLKKIEELKPHLIIANKEENEEAYVKKLSSICPVYVSDVHDFNSAIEMMSDIAHLTDRIEKGEEIISEISSRFEQITTPPNQPKIAYCIWKKPWMWAGADTFISQMLYKAGYENAIQATRYPEIKMTEIIGDDPDYIFLSSEPFPFQQKHVKVLEKEYPQSKFIIVDGEMFSWYGSRMLQAPEYFNSLLKQVKAK